MNFPDFINEWRNSEDFITVCTSGSTGKPKEIKLNKGFVSESARRTIEFFKLNSDSRLHSCVSPDFIGGKMMAVRAHQIGAKLSWETPSNSPLQDLDASKKIDLLAVVPSQMPYIIKNLQRLPSIRNIIVGGSSINSGLRKAIAESGLNAYETYGMTETASHIALRKIESSLMPFRLFEGINIDLDLRGCLRIKFKTGPVIVTNDIAEIIGEKEFFIKGRADNVIISGGRKIHPEEVERKIGHLISDPFMITGKCDEKWGQKVILLIEGHFQPDFVMKLSEEIKLLLEKWEVPKEIVFTDNLPRTPNGKLIRDFFLHDTGLSS